MTIWRMRIVCWVPNATNTLSVYVICIACPLQQRLHERALMLRYTYIVCLLTTQFHLICSSVLADSLLQSIVNTHQYPNDRRTALQQDHAIQGKKDAATLAGYSLDPGYRRVVRFTHHVPGVQTMNSTRSEASSGHGRFREENNELSLPDINLHSFRTFTLQHNHCTT